MLVHKVFFTTDILAVFPQLELFLETRNLEWKKVRFHLRDQGLNYVTGPLFYPPKSPCSGVELSNNTGTLGIELAALIISDWLNIIVLYFSQHVCFCSLCFVMPTWSYSRKHTTAGQMTKMLYNQTD